MSVHGDPEQTLLRGNTGRKSGRARSLHGLRIARVANGNKNWLSSQPSQVVKWIADLFPLFAGVA